MENQSIEDEFKERRAVDARIVRLEQVAENLASSISKLTTDVGALAQLMRESNKTNWGVMATWAGVFLMLVVALGNGYIGQPLAALTRQNAAITAAFTAHISDGHPTTVLEKVQDNTKKIAHYDLIMRREIELRQIKRDVQLTTVMNEITDIKKWQYDQDRLSLQEARENRKVTIIP